MSLVVAWFVMAALPQTQLEFLGQAVAVVLQLAASGFSLAREQRAAAGK